MQQISGWMLVAVFTAATAVNLRAQTAPATTHAQGAAIHSRLVAPGPDGKLRYTPDAQGNVIPDFSNCGYGGGGVAIPEVLVEQTLSPAVDETDDTARLQQAIDEISKLPPKANGFRGAVLLERGQYRIAGKLKLHTGGVVLRGEGDGEDGTILLATGKTQRDLVEIGGPAGPKEIAGSSVKITDDYVPVGARSFHVQNGAGFRVGDTVLVSRAGNAEWISFIGMDRIPVRTTAEGTTKQWEPFELKFDRVITAIEGNAITIDAPITCAIEQRWGGGSIVQYNDAGRIEKVGVERIRAVSEYDASVTETYRPRGGETMTYASDEAHATQFVAFGNVKNAWARNLTAVHFFHGVSALKAGAKWITVMDCTTLKPVSRLTGSRRYPFHVAGGQLSLHVRCFAEHSRHAFVFGSRVAGPNVFLDCRSENDYATSEPHHRWSVGGLYDNVHAALAFQDRANYGTGHGWAGANYIVWNCTGSLILQSPPTATNWAIGFVGEKRRGAFEPKPDGIWDSFGQHVAPRSLYLKQLEDRLGEPPTP